MSARKRIWILFVPLLAVGTIAASADTWRESSFEDFADGQFGDGGANTYVSAGGRIQTINRWDLNGDGYIDIGMSNSHPTAEALDLSIYWGNGVDFDIQRQTYVPTDGAEWVEAADLNGDGKTDLAVANYSNGSWTDMPSFVYYGGEPGDSLPNDEPGWAVAPFAGKEVLPTLAAQQVAVGDLNRDGHPDLIYALSGGHWEYRQGHDKEIQSPSRIFWGSDSGFDGARFTDLPASGAADIAIGDLNGDEWPELVFANRGLEKENDVDSYIYWGAADGFNAGRRTGLPTHKACAAEIADLNGDGRLDVIFCNEKGTASHAYLNDAGAFTPDRRLIFETSAARDCAVADFNGDGHADVFFSNHEREGNRLIDSYLYFGSPEGFSPERRQALPTIGAWGVSAADFNKDGRPDLLVCNYREKYSYETPSFVYWNTPEGFQASLRTPLYEHGAAGNAVADLNADGHLDIVIVSTIGRSRGDYDPNYVYWGNAKGEYSADERLELPGREAYEFGMADLNDDDHVDFLLANCGEVERINNEVFVYWNDDNQFSPWRVTGLPAFMNMGVELADLDRNGYLDVIVSNFGFDPAAERKGSFIYWGEAGGYAIHQRTLLEAFSRAAVIADMNGDGHPDIVFGPGPAAKSTGHPNLATIFWGDGTRNYVNDRRAFVEGSEGTAGVSVADLNKDGSLDLVLGCSKLKGDGMIYWGNESGEFSPERRTPLPMERVSSPMAADVNSDGWLDLVCPSYLAAGPPVSRTTWSPIYLGGPEGFSAERALRLRTDSGTGSLVSDFNFDGYPDVFFYCHRREGDYNKTGLYGDHVTDSFLYWGGPAGFSEDRRLGIPGAGPHNDFGVDLGHIRNRGFLFDYISSPHQFGAGRPARLSWDATTPLRSRVMLQLRVAESEAALSGAPWLGPEGPGGFYTERNSRLSMPDGAWLQYRAVLDTENGAYSPTLEMVEVEFE